jgi:hypothetical protein
MSEPEVRPERGSEQQPPRRGCAATALIVVGLLILIPSGLCTGFMTIGPLVATIFGSKRYAPTDMVQIALAIGGPFVVLGAVLTWIGFTMRRR